MIPERINALDELATVNTAYGPMEKWKARALSIGWMQRKIDEARVAGAPMCAIADAAAHDLAFLPQRPYTPPGSLRQILLDGQPKPPTNERIVEVLRSVGLDGLIAPDGDLDRVARHEDGPLRQRYASPRG
jgi:ABC-type uncharacterized transport system fused permease/ATPase subunit